MTTTATTHEVVRNVVYLGVGTCVEYRIHDNLGRYIGESFTNREEATRRALQLSEPKVDE